MPRKYCRLAQLLYDRYGVDRGNQILCKGNIENLIRLYL